MPRPLHGKAARGSTPWTSYRRQCSETCLTPLSTNQPWTKSRALICSCFDLVSLHIILVDHSRSTWAQRIIAGGSACFGAWWLTLSSKHFGIVTLPPLETGTKLVVHHQTLPSQVTPSNQPSSNLSAPWEFLTTQGRYRVGRSRNIQLTAKSELQLKEQIALKQSNHSY